jgi:hypothetical protein
MEALGALAHGSSLPVRQVVALLRRATPASPFQSARRISCVVGYRTFTVVTAVSTDTFLVD